MISKSDISGVITALVTPFKDGEIDRASFVRLIRAQMDAGVRGFVINGTTGESPNLVFSEVRELFDLAKSEVAGAAKLIVGTGSNSTARSCEVSRQVSEWNPDALLVVVPYYNKPPQRGLEAHFTEIANASSVPVILYNVPARTITALAPETVGALSGQPGIVGIKEASGDLSTFEKMRTLARPGFAFLSGDDATCVEFCRRGGEGVISVCSHVVGPELVEFIAEARAGSERAEHEFKEQFQDLMKWLYMEANPIPVKAALYWMGLIDSPELRLPLRSLDPKFQKDFQSCLEKLGKI